MQTVKELQEYLKTIPNAPEKYGIGIGSLIFTKDHKVLLIERGPKARAWHGKLEGVGGGLRPSDKNLHSALRREIREEIGSVKIEIKDFLTVIMQNFDNNWWTIAIYLCKLTSGTPVIKEPKKCTAIKYFSLDKIVETELSIPQKTTMNIYQKKFGNKPFYE